MAIIRSGNRYIHYSTIPEICHCHSTTVDKQISACRIPYLRKCPITIASQVAIALPPMPGLGAKMIRIKENACLIGLLIGHNVVQEVEFDFGASVVVDPAIGRVEVLPAIVVKIRKHRPPEPSWRIRLRLQSHIFKGAVAVVAQKSISGSHLLEDAYKSHARLAHDLHV